MAKSIRVGVIGLIHDQAWRHLEQLAEESEATLVAVADPNQPLLDRARSLFGCEVYPSCEKMLDIEPLDAVLVFNDSGSAAELAGWALDLGLHVMIERPMATSSAAAQTVLAARDHGNARLMVHWSIAFWPQMQAALELVNEGQLGDVYHVRFRAAHPGPREMGFSKFCTEWMLDPTRGGGALLDCGGFGVAVARMFIGQPKQVAASVGQFRQPALPVEDNATIVMDFARATAVAEASWSQIGELTSYAAAIYGTKGTLLVEPYQGGQLWYSDAKQPGGQAIMAPPGDKTMRHGTAHFISCLRDGRPFHPMCEGEIGRDVLQTLDAARRSAHEGSRVAVAETHQQAEQLADVVG